MSAYGLSLADLDDAACELYPDNADAAHVFIAMSTQWRVGMAGPVGLDYAALPAVLRLCAIPRAQHNELFDDLRVMEAEALAYFGEQRA